MTSFKEQLDMQFAKLRRLVLDEVERLGSVTEPSKIVEQASKTLMENSSLPTANDAACSVEDPSPTCEKNRTRNVKSDDTSLSSRAKTKTKTKIIKRRLEPKTRHGSLSKPSAEIAEIDNKEPLVTGTRSGGSLWSKSHTLFGKVWETCVSEPAPRSVSRETSAKTALPATTHISPVSGSRVPLPDVQAQEPVVVASCPEALHDEVVDICDKRNFAKAFGKKGDMVDLLSGDEWVGKWEAKVVLSAVTKAKDMNASHVKIICIQGGPHCDKEMAAQPRLKNAIKQEFRDESFRIGVEWLAIEEFREKYGMRGSVIAPKVFLCCRKTNSLEAVLNLKSELETQLPMATFWLDLEDISGDTPLQKIHTSTHVLLFLTRGATSDAHVQLQVRCAIQYRKPMVIVMETDSKHGVADLSTLLEDASEDIKTLFINNIAVPWSADRKAQLACLEKISSMIYADDVQANRGRRLQRACSSELVFGANGEPVLDPFFSKICSFAGLNLPGSSQKAKVWTYVSNLILILLSMNQVAPIISGRPYHKSKPFYRDHRDRIFCCVAPLLILCLAHDMKQLLRTNDFMDMITKYARDKTMAHDVRVLTRKIAWVLLALVIGIQIIGVVACAVQWDYETAASTWHAAMIMIGALLLLPAWAIQTCGSLLLFHVLFSVILMDFASSFHALHPQIKDLGIRDIVDNDIIVHVRDSDFVRFQTAINGSIRRASCLLRKISRVLAVLFAVWIVNFTMQSFYSFKLVRYGRHSGSGEKAHFLWFKTFWPVVIDAIILGPLAYLAAAQLNIRMWAEKLIFTKFSSRVAVLSIARDVELCAHLGPRRLAVTDQPYLVALVFIRVVQWCLELCVRDLN